MKNRLIFVSIAIAATALTLTACKPIPVAKPAKSPISPEQQRCSARCLNQHTKCIKQYNKIYDQCSYNAKRQGKLAFDAYVQGQVKKHKKIKFKQNQFTQRYLHDCTLQLKCEQNNKVCYNSCGL